MKFKVSLHLMPARKGGLYSDNKFNWRIPKDTAQEAGVILFDDSDFLLNPGEMADATLVPLDPHLWTHIKVGDSIVAFEGYHKVAEADIVEIIK